MENEIISYQEMCFREGVNLQRGMNYHLGGEYSVILMSVRPNAPYRDEVIDNGLALVYEGHDVPRSDQSIDPKSIDQPEKTDSGKLTQNGKFHNAAQEYKEGNRSPEKVKVYEKIRSGIWSYNGFFELINSWIENDGIRNVFKFKLVAVENDGITGDKQRLLEDDSSHRRIIPTSVKLEVWKRDEGKCVICGAENELHFDHIIPYSRGGTSLNSENIQLLCARHNISKGSKIV
jgi:hypothetical protein